MKKRPDNDHLLLYGLMAVTYVMLWIWHDVSTFNTSFEQGLLNNLWRIIYVTAINFVFFEFVQPFVWDKRRYVLYNILLFIGVLFVFMIIWSYGLYTWRSLGTTLSIYAPLGEITSQKKLIASQMSFSAGAVFFFALVRHGYHYVQLQKQTQRLLLEKKEAELNYLKSQTNPHFLFNTLNNIYSLARDKNDLAPESILRLSKILRFMLYETGGAYIPIEQEVKIITDYIALERLRYDESLRINFTQEIEDMKQPLPPLLLMPLVENAFKHGVSETTDYPFVDIHLSVNRSKLSFVVKNSTSSIETEK
ncbi:MAG TPA: histidine kinase, partial [Ferruginibacter sp.]|nr:histidine kinase [Ferruginibacter sp.]